MSEAGVALLAFRRLLVGKKLKSARSGTVLATLPAIRKKITGDLVFFGGDRVGEGSGLEFVKSLNFLDVILCRLLRSAILSKKAVVSLHSFPNAKLANVILKDAGAEIDIVLYLKQVDAFAVRRVPPRWQVNLHNAYCISVRDSKRVAAAFDDDDAGDEPRIQIVFSGTIHDG